MKNETREQGKPSANTGTGSVGEPGLQIKQKVPCPRCGQDWVERVRLTGLQRTVVMCPECDALWTNEQNISFSSFLNYHEFMLRNGRANPEDPAEIERVGPLELGTSSAEPGKIRCPVCNKGWIAFVRMMHHGFHFFFICKECDSSWSNIDEIGTPEVMQLRDRHQSLGLGGLTNKYDELPYPT